jgi:histidinol phosphatase-like PHP family hydrolase
MKNPIRRREFLAGAAAAGTFTVLGAGRAAAEEVAKVRTEGLDFPVIDYHVHLDGFGIEKIAGISKARGIQFGIVEHAGTKENKYPVVLGSDEDLARYIAMLEGKGVLKGVQAECIDWMTVFSKEAIAKLDFVLSDAMTFVEKDGSRVELWKAEKVKVPDKQDFMERYTEFTVRKTKEPIDIIACATFLPAVLVPEFDALWTEERMKRIIDAAVANHVAIEIAAWAKLPRMPFLKLAKAAGAKFSFASNGRGYNAGKLDYSIQMAKELGLKAADMFTPAPAGKKPIQIRKTA